MNFPLLILTGSLAVLAFMVWPRRGSRRDVTPVNLEYWVYLAGKEPPAQEAWMTEMIAENPHSRPGNPCIGAKEGVLISDIRFFYAVALRSQNPTLFRPDLFASDLVPSQETLSALSESQSFVRVRFVSEKKLSDHRYLQLVPHVAGAVNRLGPGLAVYDKEQAVLRTHQEFEDFLAESVDCRSFEKHVRVVSNPYGDEIYLQTVGMGKVGLPELRVLPFAREHETLISHILALAAEEAWNRGEYPELWETQAFEDLYYVRCVSLGRGQPMTAAVSKVVVDPRG